MQNEGDKMNPLTKQIGDKAASFARSKIGQGVYLRCQGPDKPGAPTEHHLIQGFSILIGQTGNMTINAVSVNDFPIAAMTTN